MTIKVFPLVRWGESKDNPNIVIRELLSIAEARKIESVVIVAVDSDGQVITSGTGYNIWTYSLIGGLEQMKQHVLRNLE